MEKISDPLAFSPAESTAERMARVVAIAAASVDAVDREGRFPLETAEALKHERLLGVAVPAELGGEGLGTAAVADLVVQLAQACGSSAMVYAMHQIQVSSLATHGVTSEWHRTFMRRVADEQLL
ncbi:MAG: acyl-CoA/acyl-ACP dehydrogenase, partial [Rhizobiales bacterium]|nr:acyl-CoA/acyl-ACP dehydrogenase [Hyphomicrobiales bacterium]